MASLTEHFCAKEIFARNVSLSKNKLVETFMWLFFFQQLIFALFDKLKSELFFNVKSNVVYVSVYLYFSLHDGVFECVTKNLSCMQVFCCDPGVLGNRGVFRSCLGNHRHANLGMEVASRLECLAAAVLFNGVQGGWGGSRCHNAFAGFHLPMRISWVLFGSVVFCEQAHFFISLINRKSFLLMYQHHVCLSW